MLTTTALNTNEVDNQLVVSNPFTNNDKAWLRAPFGVRARLAKQSARSERWVAAMVRRSFPAGLVALAAMLLLAASGPNRPSAATLRGSTRGGAGMDQVLIFDAGSSGTRIHIFNMSPPPAGKPVPTIDLSVRGAQTLKVKPGLSQFASNADPFGARKSVEELLYFANKFVPESRRASTPVLLKATAGLRSVSAQQAESVLEKVRDGIEQSGYMFRRDWADIIKGKEEAGLAWVAANYLQGTFNKPTKSSLGIIEMGGGSTQVSFEVDVRDSDALAEDDRFVFTSVGNRDYALYAHSYLGFGQDHAQARCLSSLPLTAIEDPCYPKGYRRASVLGTGDSEHCQEAVAKHLFGEESAPGRYAGEWPLRGSFAATENFFYARGGLALPSTGDAVSMNASAKAMCERVLTPSEDELRAMGSGTADAGKPNSCFGLSYQATLLRALGLPNLQGVEVQILKEINGADVDWALGAALVHALEGYRTMGGSWPAWSWLGFILRMAASIYFLSTTLELCMRGRGAPPVSIASAVKAIVRAPC